MFATDKPSFYEWKKRIFDCFITAVPLLAAPYQWNPKANVVAICRFF